MTRIDVPEKGTLTVRFVEEPDAWECVPSTAEATYTARALVDGVAAKLCLDGDLTFRLVKIWEIVDDFLDRDYVLRKYQADATPWPDWTGMPIEDYPAATDNELPNLGNPLGLSDEAVIAALLP